MMPLPRFLIAVLFALFMVLAASADAWAAPFKLRYIDDISIPTGFTFQNIQIGGLSSLTYDPKIGKYLSLSDDRSQFGPARFYVLDIAVSDDTLNVTPLSMIPLQTANTQVFSTLSIDPEGIAVTNDGRIFVASEGDMGQTPRLNPAVFESRIDGKFVQNISVPSTFLPESSGTQTVGVRNNLAFESLTVSPDQKNLYTANEEALLQDDTQASFTKSTRIRILEYKIDGQSLTPAREFAYDVDKIPQPLVFSATGGNDGLSEMIALGKDRFLTLERSFVYGTDNNKVDIRIYYSDCKNATDVSLYQSLRTAPITITPCTKDLVQRIETFQNDFVLKHRLDNIEGMTFGPRLPNGNSTLILVSDNNFSTTQHTQFIAFEILR
jgi:3-phytase